MLIRFSLLFGLIRNHTLHDCMFVFCPRYRVSTASSSRNFINKCRCENLNNEVWYNSTSVPLVTKGYDPTVVGSPDIWGSMPRTRRLPLLLPCPKPPQPPPVSRIHAALLHTTSGLPSHWNYPKCEKTMLQNRQHKIKTSELNNTNQHDPCDSEEKCNPL